MKAKQSRKSDGARHAPEGALKPVCQKGDFRFAAVGLDHGHIYGMCNGLVEAGGELAFVHDPDPAKVADFVKKFPGVLPVTDERSILEDRSIRLVASAAVASERGPLGLRVLDHGQDYFADKPPLTTLAQLEAARAKTRATGGKYAVYYSERLHCESAVYAGNLVADGAIGRVIQVLGLGPHRCNPSQRPAWFFEKEKYGGILCDIGSHQIEQFLFYTGARDARVLHSKVANYAHPDHPGLEDFGDATLLADNGATHYFRVDWFTPDGLGTWGDGRLFLLGTDGYIEVRKGLDVGRAAEGDQIYLVDHKGERHIDARGRAGFPFFGRLILDCLNRTELAMTQEHAFKAIELAILAENGAERVTTDKRGS
jgi:predicted dehydrogenase